MNVNNLMADLERKHPGESEYLQAVREVLESIEEVYNDHPEFESAKIVERMVEPDRIITFRVTWVDDKGEIQTNLGYRVQFNSAIGPYKGGIRFHAAVNPSMLKFLGFEQTFKNALTSRILGGVMENAGYEVKVSEVHGMAQRGGSVVTFVRYGEDVAEPIVEEGQADVLIAFERLEALRYANFLKKDGVLIVNDWRIDPISVVMGAAKYPENIIENLEKTHTVFRINAMEEALKLGSPRVFNNIVLGMAAKHMEFAREDWLKVIEAKVPPKTVEINTKAFLVGYEK